MTDPVSVEPAKERAAEAEDLLCGVSYAAFPVSPIPAVNVATVPQRSPLRYPGGKTWLIPHIRKWIGATQQPVRLLVEPFAGGGIVSLTAVMENLADRSIMAELDRDVAAFWHAALHHGQELRRRVLSFEPTRENVEALSCICPSNVVDHGFRTLVLNRTRRGGILASGASLSRVGENGKGIASRWYPGTIVDRLSKITKYADRIGFCETDGLKLLDALLSIPCSGAAIFVDPPYTAGGKRAGKRLYAHHSLDHIKLFSMLADSGVNFLMTYDEAPEIISLVRKHGFSAVHVMMKNTHHARVPELVITPLPVFIQ